MSLKQATSSFTPKGHPAVKFDFSEFPELKTPMHLQRDREWQKWLRSQADMAMEEGFLLTSSSPAIGAEQGRLACSLDLSFPSPRDLR